MRLSLYIKILNRKNARNKNHFNYKIMIRLEPRDAHYIIYGIPELEGCECYHWGENLYLVEDKDEGRYLVNVKSEKIRKISEPGKLARGY